MMSESRTEEFLEKLKEIKVLDEKTVQSVYALLPLRYEEVGSDSGQPFLVDGDSLLLDLFSDPLIDWAHGVQVGHLFYTLEKRLHHLREADRTFQIVFFECLEGIWTNPAHQMIREVMIRHLEATPAITTVRFPNWWDNQKDGKTQSFRSWTKEFGPSFVVIASGKVGPSFQGNVRMAPYLFQALTIYLLAEDIRCVRSSELAFQSHTMLSFNLRMDTNVQKAVIGKPIETSGIPKSYVPTLKFDSTLFAQLQKNVALYDPSVVAEMPKATTAPAAPAETPKESPATKGGKGKDKGAKDKGGKGKKKGGKPEPEEKEEPVAAAAATPVATMPAAPCPRLLVTAYAVTQALKEDASEANVESAKVLILTAGSLPALTIRQRAQLITKQDDIISKALNAFIAKIVVHLTAAVRFSSLPYHPNVADLIDGRMAFKLRSILTRGPDASLPLPQSIESLISTAWDLVREAIGAPKAAAKGKTASTGLGAFRPILLPASIQKTPVATPESSVELHLVHRLDSQLVKDLVPGLEEKLVKQGLMEDKVMEDKSASRNLEKLGLKALEDLPEGVGFEDGLEPEPDDEPKLTKTDLKFMARNQRRKALLNQSARRHEREKQKYLAYMQKYAKSLKGGKIVLRDVIIVPAAKDDGKGKGKGKKKKPVAAPSAPETKGKATPKTKDKAAAPAKESMADKIRGEVTKRQRAEALEKVMRFIKVADARKTLEAKIAHLDENINSLSDPMSAIPGHMKLLEWCVTAWQKSKASGNIEPAVRIWQIVNDVFRRFKGDLEPKQLVELERALMELGFDNAAKMMADEYCSLDIDWKEFKSRPDDVYLSKDKISRAFQVGTSCPRFQLHYAGHVMMRNVDSAPDERVEGFYPDKWQRDLLDVVDNKWSALVVAPTSSGKTFVSYYAMKQVLIENKIIKRSTEKGIIVYVSPTKALVNQIAGDVYQRYGPVYGVYTLDWKFRVLECDVLITVPECLEEMLLSPNKEREQWAKQIKYVILDEIHTIGNVDGNVVQRLLLLIRAPFLALSATVGNPDPFYEWLKATQKLRKREIKMIVHKERWSDLETHLYLPVLKATNPAEKAVPLQIPEPKDTFGCVPMHPCAALGDGFGLDPTEGFPPDLQFAPKDSLAMYDAMSKRLELLPPDFKTRLEALSPDVHFREVLCIDKRQAREYENILKNELFDWVKHGLQSHVDAVLRSFYDSDLKARIQQLEDREGDNTYNKEWALQHLLPMLKELHHTNRLPALMFCFDRQTCEQMVQHLTEALEEMEVAKRKEEGADEKDAQKSKAKDKLLKALKKAAEKADKKPTKKGEDRDKDKDNNERQAQELQNMEPEAEVEYPVDPRYTFVGEGEYMDGEELNWWKKRMLLKTKWDKAHPLVRALDRGIGVHHNGLNKSYKDLVETLFRVKQLKVVVSTETLALGVNMPAKTSIFALDSRFLTPLQFRQMSGRAGRRGFDNIGHVLFFAVPPRKVFRLMKSPLTSLQGHFPLSATAVLRMLTYYDRAAKSRKADVLEGLRGMLQKPFCFTTEGMRAPVDRVVREERFIGPEIEHYFRFCVEYLVRKGLINSRGQPIGLAGLVANMHSMEPSNLAFVKLLESGAISKICEKFYEKKEEVAGVLMGVMCHFFNTIPIAPDNADSLRNNADKASFVVLEPLPTDVRSVLDEHNKETVELFTQLAQVFSILELPQASNQTGELEDVSLPVSRHLLGAIPSDSKEETKTKTIAAKSSTSKAKYTPATISKASRSDDEEEVDTPRRGGKIPPVTRFHDYDLAYKDNHDEDVHTGSWEDEGGDGGENDEAEEKKGQEEVIESWEDEGGDGEEEAPKAKEEKKKKPEPAAAAKKEAKVEVKAAAGQKQNGPATKGATPEALTGILKTVAQDSLKYSAISPFVGLSGHTDKFKSARDLAESVRAGVWLEPAVVPVSQTKDLHGNDLSLNAYALDFYRHGRFALLLKDNGLKSGDAWALLKKWSLFLGDITKSLKLYATDKDNNVLRTFEYLTTKFDGYFENIGHVSSE